MYENLNCRYAAAYVRGVADDLPVHLQTMPLDELNPQEIDEVIAWGKARELKLYRFKQQDEPLPRVRRTLGFLKSVRFDSLLDVDSGRGVFLLPFMEEFPWVSVTSVDILPRRVDWLNGLRRGGIEQLTALEANICEAPFPDKSFDVVTLLEVLEHIPEVERAVCEAVRLARRYVVVSVPSKEDNNPEHIHLLTKQRLTELFAKAGCERLRFDGVNGHLFMVASINGGAK